MTTKQGIIVFRQWNQQTGLREIEKSFTTLDELFQLCLETSDTMLVDRIYIQDGPSRKLTLNFQSMTLSDDIS